MTDPDDHPDKFDDGEDGDEDDYADLSCGLVVNALGQEQCMNAGTEWCDWNCPFNSVQEATIRRQRREAPPGPLLQLMERKT